jgi:hypothetical protein
MNPSLVEPTIKYVLNHQLSNIKQGNERKKNIIFNLALFILLISIVGITLKLKYKGKQDIVAQQINEDKKKNYILSNLRKYQSMKAQPLTNIPIN